jgi:hypothetical protein
MAPLVDLAARFPDGMVPLPEVQRVAGIPRSTLRCALDDGLVELAGHVKGPGRGRPAGALTVDDVLLLVACAALAYAAGVAFVTVLRTMRETGAALDPAAGTFTIPVPIP